MAAASADRLVFDRRRRRQVALAEDQFQNTENHTDAAAAAAPIRRQTAQEPKTMSKDEDAKVNLPANEKNDRSEDANLPAKPDQEAANVYKAANAQVTYLKFRKGHYFAGAGEGEEVPLGRKFWVYAADWRRGWRLWQGGVVVDDRVVKVADNPAEPIERDELEPAHLDEQEWEEGIDGEPSDPWTLENQLPVEDAVTGERFLFTTTSFGGTIAVRAICKEWSTAVRKGLDRGLPLAELAVGQMKTKKYGLVPRPDFKRVGWECDDDSGEPVDVTPPTSAEKKKKDFGGDEIPFALIGVAVIPLLAALVEAIL
jgi:hypothetical protein